MSVLFADYALSGYYDEMFDDDAAPRAPYAGLYGEVEHLEAGVFTRKSDLAGACYLNEGITFSHHGQEHPFPFDLLPRLISAAEWRRLEDGLRQRVTALDRFLSDAYGPQRCLSDGVIPRSLLTSCKGYIREMVGITPPNDRWVHVAGIDLVRDGAGEWRVLEDNLRTPSGISYVVQNRNFMRRVFPEAFAGYAVRRVDNAPMMLRRALAAASPVDVGPARIVVLTPGPMNAAYYEHTFLAQQMGVPLAEGRDLVVRGRRVYLKTTAGYEPVDVIYRRLDDWFLDPVALRQDSLLGVPGLIGAYRAGNVAICTAPGTGIADDKAVYAYVPRLIRYYLGEEPILKQVPTYLLEDHDDREHVLANLDSLVVKAVDGAGGYGIMIGPHASSDERREFAERITANPRGYIAQDTVTLSRAPVVQGGRFAARHIDLRPFVMFGETPEVVPGGLTRVALTEGSLVVNSSQGGGSKDTWVLER
jgi:uncharacterized circularly permuted ATP-grasp superfamily protein